MGAVGRKGGIVGGSTKSGRKTPVPHTSKSHCTVATAEKCCITVTACSDSGLARISLHSNSGLSQTDCHTATNCHRKAALKGPDIKMTWKPAVYIYCFASSLIPFYLPTNVPLRRPRCPSSNNPPWCQIWLYNNSAGSVSKVFGSDVSHPSPCELLFFPACLFLPTHSEKKTTTSLLLPFLFLSTPLGMLSSRKKRERCGFFGWFDGGSS